MPASARNTIRRLATAQLLTSVGDGAVLAVSAIYFTTQVGLAPEEVALGLSAGAAVSLGTTVPFGAMLDRIGSRRALAVASVAAITGLVLFAMAQSLPIYTAACVLFACGQSALAAGRQAVVATVVEPTGRVRARALLHTAVNVGIGAGSAAGALVLAFGAAAVGVFVVDAFLFVIAVVLYLGGSPAASARRPVGWPALRDGRYVLLTALAAVTQLIMPILSVLLPVWIVAVQGGPAWLPAVVLLMNTIVVVVIQLPISRRIRDGRTARNSLVVAGASIVLACALFGAVGVFGSIETTIAVALAAAVLLTVAETTGAAGSWHLAFSLAPDGHQGQYQALFSMSAGLARVAGPIALVPLVLALGSGGWLVVGGCMLAAAVGLALMCLPVAAPRSRDKSGTGVEESVGDRAG